MDLEKAREIVSEHLLRQMKTEPFLDTPHIVREYLSAKFMGLEYELFAVIFLDARHRLIKFDEMFRGTVAYTTVYPREVAKEALRLNASAVILAHNHRDSWREDDRGEPEGRSFNLCWILRFNQSACP